MRKNLLAVALLVGVMVVVYLWMMANRTFTWQRNYLHESDEPYDCQIFDSLASATMPNGYTFWNQSLDSLMHVPGRKSLLIINNSWRSDEKLWQRVDSCLRRGDKVLVVLDDYNTYLREKYHLSTSFDYSSVSKLAKALKGHLVPDTLDWVGQAPLSVNVSQGLFSGWISHGFDSRFKPTAYLRADTLWKQLALAQQVVRSEFGGVYARDSVIQQWHEWFNYLSDDNHDLILAESKGQLRMPISVAGHIGKGWLYVSSTPIFFTNYGALDPHVSKFLNRQMAQLADYPTYRVDSKLFEKSYTGDSGDDFTKSPLSYMLSKPPLRGALYTLLAAIVLFMVFTARRRQRVVPVHEPPVNRNLEFVRLLGTIYHRRHDNIDLLRKKYTYFKDEVRRRMMIDLDDERGEEQNARLLAQRTGLDENEVATLLQHLHQTLATAGGDISSHDLISYIDQIENISKHL